MCWVMPPASPSTTLVRRMAWRTRAHRRRGQVVELLAALLLGLASARRLAAGTSERTRGTAATTAATATRTAGTDAGTRRATAAATGTATEATATAAATGT